MALPAFEDLDAAEAALPLVFALAAAEAALSLVFALAASVFAWWVGRRLDSRGEVEHPG